MQIAFLLEVDGVNSLLKIGNQSNMLLKGEPTMDVFRRLHTDGVVLKEQGVMPSDEKFKEFRSRCLSALAVRHPKGDKLYKEMKYMRSWAILEMLSCLSEEYNKYETASRSNISIAVNASVTNQNSVNFTIQQSDLENKLKEVLEPLINEVIIEKKKERPDENFLKKHWKDIIDLGAKAVSVANACGVFG